MLIYAVQIIGNEVQNDNEMLSYFLQIALKDGDEVRVCKHTELISKYFWMFSVFVPRQEIINYRIKTPLLPHSKQKQHASVQQHAYTCL